MRKLNLTKNKSKENRAKQLLLGGILIIIMFFSVLGYSFRGKNNSETNDKVIYNSLEFIKSGNHWIAQKENLRLVFKYNPNEIKRIDSNLNPLDNYLNQPLYVYSENQEAEYEIYNNLHPNSNRIVQRIQPACINEENCAQNVPIKTCEDNLIIIQPSEQINISQNLSCVFIQGPEEELVKITDEFLFKLFKIT